MSGEGLIDCSYTKPGGWLELLDWDITYRTDDDSLPSECYLEMACNYQIEACKKTGRTATPGLHLRLWMEGAGYQTVFEKVFKVPMRPWPKDEKLV